MARHVHIHIGTRDAGFEESKHPRAANGEFGKGSGKSDFTKAREGEYDDRRDAEYAKNKTAKAAEPEKKPQGRNLLRTYTTQGGDVGAKVTESVDKNGKVTYSYTGKWGAGSGIDSKTMADMEARWKESKRGHKVTEAGTEAEPKEPPPKTGPTTEIKVPLPQAKKKAPHKPAARKQASTTGGNAQAAQALALAKKLGKQADPDDHK